MDAKLSNIADQFEIDGIVKNIRPMSGGLINDTYIIETEGNNADYILQRKNKQVFTDVPAMMQNISKVSLHLKQKINNNGGDALREALTLTKTKVGHWYHQDSEGEYWTACYLIPDTVTHLKAYSPDLARTGGAAIGKFQAMLADMNEPLTDILPGFHNIRYRFEQWNDALKQDVAGRKKEVAKEIEWIESRRAEMLAFWAKVETGKLPMRVTHNDTKISNILFDEADNALAVIDLDTVLNSTCLNDYGDAIRSYTNTGEEDDTDLSNVSVDMDIFRAYTEGYLSEAISFLTDEELQSVAFSARYITFEQVLRFLMDYINGDTYYKTKYADHNLVRAKAQYKLLQSIEHNYEAMCAVVESCISKKLNA